MVHFVCHSYMVAYDCISRSKRPPWIKIDYGILPIVNFMHWQTFDPRNQVKYGRQESKFLLQSRAVPAAFQNGQMDSRPSIFRDHSTSVVGNFPTLVSNTTINNQWNENEVPHRSHSVTAGSLEGHHQGQGYTSTVAIRCETPRVDTNATVVKNFVANWQFLDHGLSTDKRGRIGRAIDKGWEQEVTDGKNEIRRK